MMCIALMPFCVDTGAFCLLALGVQRKLLARLYPGDGVSGGVIFRTRSRRPRRWLQHRRLWQDF